jgi:hypothetical protein
MKILGAFLSQVLLVSWAHCAGFHQQAEADGSVNVEGRKKIDFKDIKPFKEVICVDSTMATMGIGLMRGLIFFSDPVNQRMSNGDITPIRIKQDNFYYADNFMLPLKSWLLNRMPVTGRTDQARFGFAHASSVNLFSLEDQNKILTHGIEAYFADQKDFRNPYVVLPIVRYLLIDGELVATADLPPKPSSFFGRSITTNEKSPVRLCAKPLEKILAPFLDKYPNKKSFYNNKVLDVNRLAINQDFRDYVNDLEFKSRRNSEKPTKAKP